MQLHGSISSTHQEKLCFFKLCVFYCYFFGAFSQLPDVCLYHYMALLKIWVSTVQKQNTCYIYEEGKENSIIE